MSNEPTPPTTPATDELVTENGEALTTEGGEALTLDVTPPKK